MAQKHRNNLAWRVGGPQGSGVDTAARIFANACLAGRLHVFGRREVYSNIMGRHSYYDVRLAGRPMSCHRSQVDFLTTFEAETLAGPSCKRGAFWRRGRTWSWSSRRASPRA